MAQEDKELLLADLCARLPYGVKLYVNITESSFCSSYINKVKDTKINGSVRLCGIQDNGIRITVPYGTTMFISNWELEKCEFKPYLRPMSNMTEEEKVEYEEFIIYTEYDTSSLNGHYELNVVEVKNIPTYINWLNKHHFDYLGLIDKGLAIEATEEIY